MIWSNLLESFTICWWVLITKILIQKLCKWIKFAMHLCGGQWKCLTKERNCLFTLKNVPQHYKEAKADQVWAWHRDRLLCFFLVGCCMINATHRGAASYLSNAFVRPSYNYSRPLLEGKIVLFSTFLLVATKHLVLPAGVLWRVKFAQQLNVQFLHLM